MRRGAISAVAIGAVLLLSSFFLPSVSSAQDTKPDATLKLSQASVAAGVGFSWGSGILVYKDKDYPFKISGLSVGEVGITRAEAAGEVYNLSKLEDFTGTYTAASAEATAGGGAGKTAMRNQNGVVIRLYSATQGINLKLAVDGVRVTLK
jgi:hypothetical protein